MSRPSLRVTTTAAALTGVVVAHSLGAVLAFSDAHQRSEHLAATGHGYWPAAVWLALAGGALAILSAVAGGAGWGAPAAPRFSALAGRQLVVFAVMEVVERLSVGTPLAALGHDPAFVLGLVLQMATAAALTLALRRLHRIAARIAAYLRAPRRLRRPSSAWRPLRHVLPQSPVAGQTRSRAPPGTGLTRPACPTL